MKKICILLLVLSFSLISLGQTPCSVILPGDTHKLPNDTTIISQNTSPSISAFYLPCKSLKIDSSITVQNTIFLRPGTSFTTDSLSTLFGGYFIYADSGATVDMNHKTALSLYYKAGATLLDTNMTTCILCPTLTFDYSMMIEDPNCFALSIGEVEAGKGFQVFQQVDGWSIRYDKSGGKVSWQLFSIDGARIQVGNSPYSSFFISRQDLTQGIYILQIMNNNRLTSLKLMAY